MSKEKTLKKERRHNRIRAIVKGSENRPRLCVFRSLQTTYAQLINDEKGVVLAAASDLKNKGKDNKTNRAKKIGLELAKKAIEKNISQCVFDRNGYKYHGRVKALAEGAREGGLNF